MIYVSCANATFSPPRRIDILVWHFKGRPIVQMTRYIANVSLVISHIVFQFDPVSS